MATLADIPFLSGYTQQNAINREQDTQNIRNQVGQMGVLAQLQAQQEKRRQVEQDQAFRTEMQGLGPSPTQEQLSAVSAKYAKPESVLTSQTASADRRVQMQLNAANQEENRAARVQATKDRIEAAIEAARQRGVDAQILKQMEISGRETLLRLGASLRQPREEPAPSMSEVVDPKDPTRLLRINAREYRGGSLGDVGVLGVSGKEPGAAKREEGKEKAGDLLKSELDNLRMDYKALNDAKAIPSSERGSMSNVAAWTQASTVGQLGGRMTGTKEQDARNRIQSARLRVMNAIKNATGMSAQMLNSNVELKTWLDSLTDPSKTYETNVGIIDAIEQAYLKGGKSSGTGPPAAGQSASGGIRFLGFEKP